MMMEAFSWFLIDLALAMLAFCLSPPSPQIMMEAHASSHGVLSPKYDMDAYMATCTVVFRRWVLGLVFKVGSSKKLDPTRNINPANILPNLIKI